MIPYFLLSSEMYVLDCRFLLLFVCSVLALVLFSCAFHSCSRSSLCSCSSCSYIYRVYVFCWIMLMHMLLIMYMRALRAGLTSRLDRNRKGWMGINKCTRYVELNWNGMGLKGLG